MSVQIPLTQGKAATVCDCHAHLVTDRKWHAVYDPHTKTYRAVRNSERRPDEKRKNIYMSRVIMDAGAEDVVDHIDKDTLNNRCENLRIAKDGQNTRNAKMRSDNRSGFKGVGWHKHERKWIARVRINSKQVTLGYFSNPIDAAIAYDCAARKYYGEFASTNFQPSVCDCIKPKQVETLMLGNGG